MSQEAKDYKKAPCSLTVTIGYNIDKRAQKTESLFSSACIYRVPEELRKLNESAYTPLLIAIGPLHRDDKHLQTTIQHVKSSYTNYLFCRLTGGIKDPQSAREKKFEVLQECVAEMKKLIDIAKKCYAEEVMLDEEILLVDGCFILELLYRFSLLPKEEKTPTKGGDSGNSKARTRIQQPLPLGQTRMQETIIQQPMPLGQTLMQEKVTQHPLPLGQTRMEETIIQQRLPETIIQQPLPLGQTRMQETIICRSPGETRMKNHERPQEGEDRTKSSNSQKTADPIFDSILAANTVQHDLLLLENQIPFFVLEKLFQLTVDQIPKRPHNYSLTDYVSGYFGNMMSPKSKSKTSDSCCSPSDLVLWVFGNGNQMKNSKEEEDDIRGTSANYNHILHKLHEHYLPCEETKKKEYNEIMPSASNLDYAGVEFVPGTGSDLFSVKFSEPKGPFWWCHRARFEIPPLGIYDPTEAFLRNLIAFEQCCPGASQHFTSYAYLMDMLVNSEKDVEVLEKAGVLHNYLGASEDATDLFNKLCKEVALGEFFFADKCNEAAKYSERCWPKNMAHVRRKYFASPWTFIAFFLAFIAFCMSITSFVRSFLK